MPNALAVSSFEANRLLELEEEVRTLIGKIELLEHQVRLLQKSAVVSGKEATEVDIAQMAKRIDEPTMPLGANQAYSQNNITPPTEQRDSSLSMVDTAPAPSSSSLLSQYEEAESNQFLAKQHSNAAKNNKISNVGVAPQSPSAPKASNITAQPQNTKGEREMYEIALANFKDKHYVIAQKNLAAFISQYPQSSLISNAYFWLGESYYRQNYNENAAVQYLKSYKALPTGGKAADALLMLSFALNKLGKKEEACSMLVRLEQEFPKRPTSSLKRAGDAKLKFACPNS